MKSLLMSGRTRLVSVLAVIVTLSAMAPLITSASSATPTDITMVPAGVFGLVEAEIGENLTLTATLTD